MARILLVEDEQIIALDLASSLKASGHEVVGPVDNGRDALILAQDHQPDLALMDVMIRGTMDGIEAGRLLREIGIPVIYLTAYSDAGTVRRAAESMPFGFLTKPFQRHEVLASIEIALYKAQVERDLQERQRRLIAEKDQFLALITHEIRTPIAAINAAAESLRILDGADVSPERARRYERISNSIRRVGRLIDLAVNMDRLGNQSLGAVEVDMVSLTHEMLQQFPPEQRARMDVHAAEAAVCVRAFPELLQFPLTNLLDNALKFSPPDTPVSIDIRVVHTSRFVQWAVTDQGPGVPVDERARIFEKYYRSSSTAMPGLGLGLYISRQLVTGLGGQLRYQQPSGPGACFEIWLPLSASPDVCHAP